MVNSLDYLPGLGLRDYAWLCFNLYCYAECKGQDGPHYCYDHGDYGLLNNLLEIMEWEGDIERLHYNEAWDYFAESYNEITVDYIPKNKCVKKNLNKYLTQEAKKLNKYLTQETKKLSKYLTQEAMKCKHKKYHHWKVFMETEDYLEYARFVQACNFLKGLTRIPGKFIC